MNEKMDDAPAVLLLYIMKVYDCLNQGYMLLTLRKFGFDETLVNLVRRIHKDTTARFSVNGELSSVQVMKSGIR